MRISIVAVIGKNRELGKDNKLIWHIKEDLQRFKSLTLDRTIIMGRKTFESIGRPLPNRTNFIISRNPNRNFPNCIFFVSLGEAIRKAKELEILKKEKDKGDIFIIGGGQIYEQVLPIADKLYLTIVDADFDADTFFPDYSEFKKVISKEKHDNGEYKYTFLELEK